MKEESEFIRRFEIEMWEDTAKGVVIFVVICFIVFAIVVGIACLFFHFCEKEDNALWNNGVCSECGGNYEYEQAVGHKTDTSYIYKCEQCDHRIEVSNFKERRIDDRSY